MSASAPAARTCVWVDLSVVDPSVALSLLLVGHSPSTHLIGVSVGEYARAVRMANWLKVTGLLTVPVYMPKVEEDDEKAAASNKSTAASDTSILVGARYPPLSTGTIHAKSAEGAIAEAATKHATTIRRIQIGGESSSSAAGAGVGVTRDDIRALAASFATPFGQLIVDIIDEPTFNIDALNTYLLQSGISDLTLSDALTRANEKSHLNKVRKSKAPSQKAVKPGQVAAASTSGTEEHVYPPPGPLPPATPLAPLEPDSPLIHLQEAVKGHLANMLTDSLMYDEKKGEHLFILYDQENELTRLLARGYRAFIDSHHLNDQQATFLNFTDDTPDSILCRLWALKAHDSVILIQSQQFRLNDYRIRLELFKRSIRSIEHVHLQIIAPEEYDPYVAALAFSPKEYGALAYTLKEVVDKADKIVVECQGGERCEYTPTADGESCMQPCKLNIGDYRFMGQVGGTYPIGEVFTEARSLSSVNGVLPIFGYPSLQKKLVMLEEPIHLHIVNGVLQFDLNASPPIIPLHATPDFIELLSIIQAGEGEIVIREFGMGLNRGMSRTRTVADIFAFERQHGLHISLGKKHNVFKVDGIKGKQTTFHIDVFVDVNTIACDGKNIFENNEWTVEINKNYRGEPLTNEQNEEKE